MLNMRISHRLIILSIFTSLMTVIVGIFGYSGISIIVDSLDLLSNDNIPCTLYLFQIKQNIDGIRRAELNSHIHYEKSGDVVKDEEAKLKSAMEKIANSIQKYESSPMPADESAMWNSFKLYFNKFEENVQDSLSLLNKGKASQALEISTVDGSYNYRQASSFIDQLVAFTSNEMHDNSVNSFISANNYKTWIIVGIIVCISASAILSLIISLAISKSLKRILNYTFSVASGDLESKISISKKNEFGMIANNVEHMVNQLKNKILEADDQTRQIEIQVEEANNAKLLAQTSLQKAERAKANGMLQAAQELEGVVEVITSASEELSIQITQSSRGAEEQFQQINGMVISMEEMNVTVLDVAKNASRASEASDGARSKAQQGAIIVSQVVGAINEVQKQALTLKADMGGLSLQAEGIGQIINVISDIADQTNLLALNAAIEAARAGEAGRGFAVVADEVRKLAEKTMTATREVDEAIRGIQDGTRKNMDNVDRTTQTIAEVTSQAEMSGETLNEIVSMVNQSSDQVRAIATASEEQSATSEGIKHSIECVASISSDTTQAMGQAEYAVSELARQAQVLQELIKSMKSNNKESTESQNLTIKKR